MSMRRVCSIFVVSLAVCFGCSHLSKSIGDIFFDNHQEKQAVVAYTVAQLFNPFIHGIDERMLAVRIVDDEQASISEETADLPVASVPALTDVLGDSVTIPILMYHYIRINPDPRDIVGYNLSVTPYMFNAQMDYLSEHWYHPITLDQLGAALFRNKPLPPKPVVITLDDGYRDAYTAAFPILKRHGFNAVDFVITGVVDGPSLYLTWQQIAEMKKSGVFNFESHTVTHRRLTGLNAKEVLREVTESKRTLEAHLGEPVYWIAYPGGNVNGFVVGITRQARTSFGEYLGGFGTNFGTYQTINSLFTLRRVRIGGGDTVSSFGSKLPWK